VFPTQALRFLISFVTNRERVSCKAPSGQGLFHVLGPGTFGVVVYRCPNGHACLYPRTAEKGDLLGNSLLSTCSLAGS
jgi:hypothetical protein